MNLVRVVGARPQFMQAAPLRRRLARRGHAETLVHTGQHYDVSMSRVFFEELGLPAPDVNLGVGSGPHGAQTGRMMEALEAYLVAHPADAVVVDGDTNSTLAGALTAAKLCVPLVHVEAGLRSYDRGMPEEVNRVVADHLGSLLCAPTGRAMSNLADEGLPEAAVLTGDLMYDCFLGYRERSDPQVLADLNVSPGEYFLATVHRADNIDRRQRLDGILSALAELPMPVVFPVHPRSRGPVEEMIEARGSAGSLHLTDPVGYLEMLALEAGARCILTDSGGVQREAYFWRRPSVILRECTEWLELVDSGWSILAGAQRDRILDAVSALEALADSPPESGGEDLFGGGRAADRIIDAMEARLT
jgi:UDP-N-acetylglucosamine 2-epimerase